MQCNAILYSRDKSLSYKNISRKGYLEVNPIQKIPRNKNEKVKSRI